MLPKFLLEGNVAEGSIRWHVVEGSIGWHVVEGSIGWHVEGSIGWHVVEASIGWHVVEGWNWMELLDGIAAMVCNTRKTRMLQLQATVKRFQVDLHVNLEGQHMLINSWSQR